IKERKDVFESTENDFSATCEQNELLKDQLLEAKLKHEIKCYVLLSHECVNNNVQDEIKKIQRDSTEIQMGLKAASTVRGPLNNDSSFKNSALSITKKSSKRVEVSDRTNNKSNVTS
nr:hypothetical protein [Tanacetum cinerariifolium]